MDQHMYIVNIFNIQPFENQLRQKDRERGITKQKKSWTNINENQTQVISKIVISLLKSNKWENSSDKTYLHFFHLNFDSTQLRPAIKWTKGLDEGRQQKQQKCSECNKNICFI